MAFVVASDCRNRSENHARGRARVAILETPRQILEQASGPWRPPPGRPGPRWRDPGTLALRHMLQDVPQLVDVTPVNQRGGAAALKFQQLLWDVPVRST